MTIEEAEAYYKRYLGHGFHMCREEPGRYEIYKRLNLPKECFVQWDNDLLDTEFQNMWSDPERVWVHQGHILEVFSRGNCNAETVVTRLLDEMEKMGSLSLPYRTLITENMAGRTASLTDGGVYLICSRTGLSKRMKEVMKNIVRRDADADDRYKKAVVRYEAAVRRFCRE